MLQRSAFVRRLIKENILLLFIIYRNGLMPITTVFFDEFSTLLATLSKYTCHLLIFGYINVKFDQSQNVNTKHMLRLLTSHNLTKLILEPTHKIGQMLLSRSLISWCPGFGVRGLEI